MAPRRPVLFPDQVPTAILSVVLLVAGVVAVVVLFVTHS
jgi:hypothetical protein